MDDLHGNLNVSNGMIIKDADNTEYQITKLLGKGTFGQVFEVVNLTNKQVLALKVAKSLQAYKNQALSELRMHDILKENTTPEEQSYLCLCHTWFNYHGHICAVMPLLSYDFYYILKKRNFKGIDLCLVQPVLRSILHALSVMHRCNIIHSDVKPENVLLVDKNGLDTKLIDYGSSFQVGAKISVYIQSRFYRAPEVILQCYPNAKIDIWSTACFAFEIFTGSVLFPGRSELHMLSLIVSLLGQFPAKFIQKSPRQNFFNDGILKSYEELCLQEHKTPDHYKSIFLHGSLHDNILNYSRSKNPALHPPSPDEISKRQIFIDLLMKMLALDPDDRIDADTALQHPFFQIRF